MKKEFHEIYLDGVIDEYFWKSVERFKYRADNLNEFRANVKWGMHHSSVNRSNPKEPKISGTLPDELVLEGLYRRFRFFILNNESSNYRRLLKSLGRAATNDWARLYFRYIRNTFLDNKLIRFAFTTEPLYTAEQIIDCWFNAHYFHDIEKKIVHLNKLESIVSKKGAKVSLFSAVWDACNEIRNARWLLKDTTPENPKVLVPYMCYI